MAISTTHHAELNEATGQSLITALTSKQFIAGNKSFTSVLGAKFTSDLYCINTKPNKT